MILTPTITVISDRLRNAIRTADERQYKLARRAGLDPSVISKWMNHIADPKRGDPRVVKLAPPSWPTS